MNKILGPRKEVLGLDFGGVISQGHTTQELMSGVVESVKKLSDTRFGNNIWIISRVDNDESRRRVLQYMKERDLWNRMGIPKGNARFCILRSDKAAIANELEITHFVDDHTEILLSMTTVANKFAMNTKAEELAEYPPVGIHLCSKWSDIMRILENE